MELLDQYLKAVRMYLAPGQPHDDIVNELRENLLAQLEEREAGLGRPLTDREQEALLTGHGNPMVVAGRYGATTRGVSFGWQLIGPELFPMYWRVLALNWGISILVHSTMALFMEKPPGVRPFLFSVSLQWLVATVAFILVERLQRSSKQRWCFPPAYLQPIPRWQSAAGLVLWIPFTLWWGAIPFSPSLLFGPLAEALTLTPGWMAFHWPALLLLLAGIGQRAVNLWRPRLNWLQPSTRFVVNTIAFVMACLIPARYPYVLVAEGARHLPHLQTLARALNELVWWSAVTGFNVYFLINAVIYGWQCRQHLRSVLRRRSDTGRPEPV